MDPVETPTKPYSVTLLGAYKVVGDHCGYLWGRGRGRRCGGSIYLTTVQREKDGTPRLRCDVCGQSHGGAIFPPSTEK
jgi:hypothetical protein